MSSKGSICGCKDRPNYRDSQNCTNCACVEEVVKYGHGETVYICSLEDKTDILVDENEVCDLWEEQ